MSAPHESAPGPTPKAPPHPPDNDSTGLPGLRTWPSLYSFVLGCFLLWVLLLLALGRVFP